MPSVLELAKKYNKSAAQILLRHLLQKDILIIPKSAFNFLPRLYACLLLVLRQKPKTRQGEHRTFRL